MFPCILYFFIHPKPNNIGPARQQPRDWGSLLISLSLVGERGHSYYLLALRLLDYMGFCDLQWKHRRNGRWRGGGGTHSSSTALGLGISAPPPPPQHTPNFRVFCLGLGGGTKVFCPRRPDYRRFEIPSFTSPDHTHSLVYAPTAAFSFSRPVMSYK